VGEIFRTPPDPASYAMGTRSFLGLQWPGRGVDHPSSSSPEVKERVELYLYSPSGPLWPFLGGTSLFAFAIVLVADFVSFPFKFLQHECYRTYLFILASTEFTCFSGFVCFLGPHLHND